MDSVTRLPEGARLLASSEGEPIQAFAVGKAIRGVQFHPEIDGDAMRAYVAARAHLIAAEGGDPEAVRVRSTDAPDAAQTLQNFVRAFAAR